MRTWSLRCAAFGLAVITNFSAGAGERVTFALTSTRAWDFSVVTYGERLGFFAEQGIEAHVAQTENLTASLQAVIAGSVDIGIVPMSPFMSARMQGAPIKMISALFNGASDWLWYVRSDSPIQTLKDSTPETTIGVSSLGSTSHILSLAMLEQSGAAGGEVVGAGSSAATLTEVMTEHIDVGTDGNGLLGVPEYAAGNIRPIAYGRDLQSMKDVTVRGMVVREDTLAARRDTLVRFVQAYKKTIDWMYENPEAVEWFAEQTESTLDEATRVKEDCYPVGAMVVGDIAGLETSIAVGLEFKRIEREPTAEELSQMFDVVWTPGSM
jgi:NitT/TauT family transport system substrate-binding protein